MKHRLSTSAFLFLLLVGTTNAFVPTSQHRGLPTNVIQTTPTNPLSQSLVFPSQPSPFSRTTTTTTSQTTTSVQMSAAPLVPIAAITGAITGGFFAGGLHAIAGPDHLAALLPRCCGQRWFKAGRIGALWGMGHGISCTLLGILAFGLKNQVSRAPVMKSVLSKASHVTEIAVGLSLILIGVMGMKEAREWEDDMVEGGQPQSLSAAAADAGVKSAQKRAVIFNGLLHGFSWDGAPSLAPALAVATWSGNIAFLSAYAAGTIGAMAVATTLIGEGTRRAGEFFNRPDIPQKLSYFTSIFAIGIGALWCGFALI